MFPSIPAMVLKTLCIGPTRRSIAETSVLRVARENLLDIYAFILISKAQLQRMRFLIVHERDLIRRAIWQRSLSRRFVEIRSLHPGK
jgi:hypothetical protein